MEPHPKRVRLFGPVESNDPTLSESNSYSDLYDEEDSILHAGKCDIEEEKNDGATQDADIELDQIRARLDHKLKSKFEAIFEKYGRDFTGIGDEIDLRTGEIVVDNGHLLEMQDERDAGTSKPGILASFTQEAQPRSGSVETEGFKSDEVDESHVAPEDMEEDDMIFFQNSANSDGIQRTPLPRSGYENVWQQTHESRLPSLPSPDPRDPYPSESQIMAQFGQRLGPQIARYVSQQRVQDNSNVEPAWRTPGLPLATPGKRPILKSILFDPGADRSPSPKGSSVWAPSMPRGRRRRDGADVAAVFKGETIVRDRKWYSSGFVSTTVTKKITERADQSQSSRTASVPLMKVKSRRDVESYGKRSKTSPGRKIVSYDMEAVSDCEEESSECESTSHYQNFHPYSDPEIIRDPGKLNNIESNMAVVESRSLAIPRHLPHLKHKREGDRAPKVAFTQADDDAVIEWVEKAQKMGFSLWSQDHWKMLADKNPRHTYLSWQDRYRRRLWPRGVIGSIQEEELGAGLTEIITQPSPALWVESESASEPEHVYSSDESIQEISKTVFYQDSSSSQIRQVLKGHLGNERRVKSPQTGLALSDDLIGKPADSLCASTSSLRAQDKLAVDAEGDDQETYVDDVGKRLLHMNLPLESALVRRTTFDSLEHEDNEPTNLNSFHQVKSSFQRSIPVNVCSSVADIPSAIIKERHRPELQSSNLSTITLLGAQEMAQVSPNSFGPSYGFSDEEDETHSKTARSIIMEKDLENEPSIGREIIGDGPSVQKELPEDELFAERKVLKKQPSTERDVSMGQSSPCMNVPEEPFLIQEETLEEKNMALVDTLEVQSSTPDDIPKGSPPPSMKTLRGQTPKVNEVLGDVSSTEMDPFERERRSTYLEVFQEQAQAEIKVLEVQPPVQGGSAEAQPSASIAIPETPQYIQLNAPKKGDSIQMQDKEGDIHDTVGEVHCFEELVGNAGPLHGVTIEQPSIRRSPSSIVLSPTLPKKSSAQMERFRLQEPRSPQSPGTPSSITSRPQPQKLSSILGSDDFEELYRSPESLATPALQVGRNVSDNDGGNETDSLGDSKTNLACTITPRTTTVRRTIRLGNLMRIASPCPTNTLIKTPGSTLRRCGDSGYKCTKEFCFKCIGD